ncbi:hypothetical protein F0562_001700 [Nyssa sinensis]|uniref:Mind bomb SH3 repeat domain-containing protein n=1 Tax=Nyssa sinensis TaxID=561372 RepID=A0A5J5C4X3_9ASTE|nr:hypothetical protein F0562_001700 [Nyssa sinensis]
MSLSFSIGIIHSLDDDGDMAVAFCFRSKPFSCYVTNMEKVSPFEVRVAGRVNLWKVALGDAERLLGFVDVHYTEVEKVDCFTTKQYVRFRAGLAEPRWGWRGACPKSRGVIVGVNANRGVSVSFFGLVGFWIGDPADLEVEQMFEVGEWVKLKDGTNKWKSIVPRSIGVM